MSGISMLTKCASGKREEKLAERFRHTNFDAGMLLNSYSY